MNGQQQKIWHFPVADKIVIKNNTARFTWHSLSSYSRHLSENSCVTSYFVLFHRHVSYIYTRNRSLLTFRQFFFLKYKELSVYSNMEAILILPSVPWNNETSQQFTPTPNHRTQKHLRRSQQFSSTNLSNLLFFHSYVHESRNPSVKSLHVGYKGSNSTNS